MEMCQLAENNYPCHQDCDKCHNWVEQLYHPAKYKTKFWAFFPNNLDQCEYGKYCSFAHSEDEIHAELIHHLPRT